jgi:hypothetical protein
LEQNFGRLQERPLIQRGAEGANPDKIGTKLSGKRTVTYLNPGKIQPFNSHAGFTPGVNRRVGHRRGKIPPMVGIISQVKRQEEGDTNKIVFLFFILGKFKESWVQ